VRVPSDNKLPLSSQVYVTPSTFVKRLASSYSQVWVVTTVGAIVLVIAVRLPKNAKTSEVFRNLGGLIESEGCYYFRIGSGDDFAKRVEALKRAFHYAEWAWNSDRRA
jgi:hypothetical protein